MNRYSRKFRQTIATTLARLAAVLAVSGTAGADVQRREVVPEVSLSLGLADGTSKRCDVKAWSGVGLEGSCGSYRWERLKAGSALAVLKAVVSAKDADAARDALAVVLSLPDVGTAGPLAVDWAKRQGLDADGVQAARKEAERLATARAEEASRAAEARAVRASPEGANFSTAAWTVASAEQFADASVRMVEAARGLLARAGGSATLHESAHVVVLAESDDPAFVREAAALETFHGEWSERLAAAGITLASQARVPVIFVSDNDRWRQIVTTAFGGDPAMHPDSVTVYVSVDAQDPRPMPIVLVAPEGDRSRARYAAAVGLARAMLHYSDRPARPPAFVNDALARVMADVSVPSAGMDVSLRRQALTAIRGGGSFVPVVTSGYSDPIWCDDPRAARAAAYLFVRWLWDNQPTRLLRFAKDSGAWGGPGSPTLESRFERSFGMTLQAACGRAKEWFEKND